jgi:hypothetical protein
MIFLFNERKNHKVIATHENDVIKTLLQEVSKECAADLFVCGAS